MRSRRCGWAPMIICPSRLISSCCAFRCKRRWNTRPWWLKAAVVLFLPTVVLNSSLWGQIDATYASLGLGGLYFVLRRRPWLACTFFGLALSFKLQVVFLFPVLLLLVL